MVLGTIEEQQERVARALLEIKAVFLRPSQPFTWASGIKSPIYCDNRLILSYPGVRNIVEEHIAALIDREYKDRAVLMGTATAGIAHAALVANILDLPMGYVRSSAKDHGRTNQIEGALNKGDNVVIIEDLISTAGSVKDTAIVLKEAGANVLGVASIFTYGMKKSEDTLASIGLGYKSVCNLDTLLNVAVKDGYISTKERDQVLTFRDNPSDESWIGK